MCQLFLANIYFDLVAVEAPEAAAKAKSHGKKRKKATESATKEGMTVVCPVTLAAVPLVVSIRASSNHPQATAKVSSRPTINVDEDVKLIYHHASMRSCQSSYKKVLEVDQV
ncbi:hypothetical protein Adt_26644 [Abeliophyllum distichum]|uniref:Uncharacterized protein n=1 Tax=Abeliophyllum distichum TaxID=126358 RepID=A0ABD1RRG5_9LAMI